MTRSLRTALALALLLSGAACATASTAPAPEGRPRSRAQLITAEEIRTRGQYSNLYDVVAHLRPQWLNSKGPDALMGSQGQIQVHMDGNLLGPVSVLRNLSASGVSSIEWVPPIDASARFGLDHAHGAIIVSTSARGG